MAGWARCSEYFNCDKRDCAAFAMTHGRCWLIAGTLCRDEVQGQVLEKLEVCLDCRFFQENMDRDAVDETFRRISQLVKELKHTVAERDRELEATTLEMAVGFSEVFEALKAIAAGNPSMRIPEDSGLELVSKLKHMVNLTAENLGEIVELSHEFAIGLAEHFDVLHRVSNGDLNARVAGHSSVELLELLKTMTNRTIENIALAMIERLRAEQALKESESKYRLIVNQIPEVVFTGYADWSVDFYDRKIEQLTGYPKEDFDLRRLKWIDLVVLEDLEKVKQGIVTGLKTTQSYLDEYRLSKKDGGVLWVQVRGQIFNTPDGKIDHISGVIHDITEQKQAEQSLKQSEGLLNSIFRSAPIGIGVTYDRVLGLTNDYLTRIVGYGCHELTGKTARLLYATDDEYDRVGRVCYDDLSTSGRRTTETRWHRMDGEPIDVSFSTSPIDPTDISAGVVFTALDITARKQAEQALRDSESHYRAIVSAFDGFIYICSQDGRIEFMNDKLIQLTGYNAVGEVCHEALHGLDNVCSWCVRDRVFQGEIIRREVESPKDNGWYYVVNVPIVHPDGSVSKQTVIQDITERKRAEEEIKLNEIRLEASLRLNEMIVAPLQEIGEFALEAGVGLTGSMIGYFVLLNADESVLTMHTWSKSTMAECQATDLTHLYPVDSTGLWGEAARQRRAIITNDYNAPNPWKQSHPEGHVAIHRHMNVPVFDGDRIVLVAGVVNKPSEYNDSDVRQLTLLMSDLWRILQRKQAEEALRDSEEKYRLLIGNIPGIAFRGYADGRIEFFEEKIEVLTGYALEDFTSGRLKWTDLILQEDTEDFRSAFHRALKGNRSYIREYRIVTRDHKTLWVQGRGRIVCDENGHVDYVSGVIFDITERKQGEELRRKLETQLNQAHKMEAIGTLAGGIAHDFNNILTAMIGYTELAQSRLRKAPQESQALRHLDEILRAGDRAKGLVNQILAFSRQTEQMRKPVEICMIIEEVLRFLRATIPSTVEIRPFLDAPGGIVMADPVQIHQVLINLCSNAYQSMEGQRGVLEIKAEPVEVDRQLANVYPDLNTGSHIRITVSDTGYGMTPAVLERVFDPFFTTKQPGKGTGLGLSVVHGIIKGLGGAISVESEVGKGTTFQIFLPRHASAAVAETIQENSNLSGNEQILLVDDETQLIEMATIALGEFGYQVSAFNGSLQALEAFRAQPQRFDLVITDLTMPHLTGIELATEMKRLRADVPVILVTGFSEDTAWKKAKEAGIQDCLLKPIIVSDLAKAIRRILDHDGTTGSPIDAASSK
jgi:PAS domain S-box-containing protein